MKRLRISGLTPVLRGVLLAQYSYADRDGTNSRPSEKTLAEDLGISDSMLRRHRKALRAAGWLIERERGVNMGSGGASRASKYEVVIPVATGTIVPVGNRGENFSDAGKNAGDSNPQPEPPCPKGQLATGTIVPPTVGTEDQLRTIDDPGEPKGSSEREDFNSKGAQVSSGSSSTEAFQAEAKGSSPMPLDSPLERPPAASAYFDAVQPW